MWPKRKPKNRRLEREHLLQVTLRSSKMRAVRLRRAAGALGVLLATVAVVLLFWRGGQWVLARLAYENQSFALQEINIETDGVISVNQLRRWSGLKIGQNLLALDLGRVKRDLELASVIQAVSIERILPHTLCIRITEREPIAQVNTAQPRAQGGAELAAYQLDADGYVMLPLGAGQRATAANDSAEALTLISGISANELQPGRRLESPQVQAALQLILAFERSPMAGLAELKRIDVSLPEILLVRTSQGSELTFGLSALDQQLRRWREIFDTGQKLGRAIASLDLAVTNNLPARWLEASALPLGPVKPVKTLHLRKKHV